MLQKELLQKEFSISTNVAFSLTLIISDGRRKGWYTYESEKHLFPFDSSGTPYYSYWYYQRLY